jgi:formate C-acetyltransferase
MNPRVTRLREQSFKAEPCISAERALLVTEFYKENYGKYSVPVLRALNFKNLCAQKTIYIGDDELIVGERGPFPKSVSTFPELTCHSLEDLKILDSRKMTRYAVSDETLKIYQDTVIPYWRGRTMRERVFRQVPDQWKLAYEAGIFTEFMEQRAPGHTTLDGIIYRQGMLDFKAEIADSLAGVDYLNDPEAAAKADELKAMDICCDAAIIFAQRHADLAREMAAKEGDPHRRKELERIAAICRRVPARAPRDFWESLQMYWFVHLGTITELNGWDAMNPGHLDQHLFPFYEKDLAANTLDRDTAKELIECLWIKFNNHPAPPKVGVTALESGTYNDFTNINIGGIKRDGSDGVNAVSYIMLEAVDELHLLQPGSNVQISHKTPNRFLKAACRVIRTLEDAREGGCSGCIETGAFGKEAYILTGYLNVPKILELALNNGCDPLTGKVVGLKTADPKTFKDYKALYEAFVNQLNYIVDLKIKVNNYIERMYAGHAPAPFLSVVIADCIARGKDYYNGGPRYNTNYIQCCGIGTVTDSLSAIKKHVFENKAVAMDDLLTALQHNFEKHEALRLRLWNKTPFYGNDDNDADAIMQRVYADLFEAIDGKPNTKGTTYHLNMLSTTCHVYFGKMLGASANGRLAGQPVSDGTSPSHGADRNGPTAVIKSLAKMDQIKSGGTLLNQRFLPGILKDEEGIEKLCHLIRTYFNLNGHHIQFNIVDSETLRQAQQKPEAYRDLLVRVAGYSDYFVDLDADHQEEIIARTQHDSI